MCVCACACAYQHESEYILSDEKGLTFTYNYVHDLSPDFLSLLFFFDYHS